jgi:type III restriction enzyme
MQLKEYQNETLKEVRVYLEKLAEVRAEVAGVKRKIDWAAMAWEEVKGGSYVPRRNGLGNWLPSFCLKIPTGGGKTLLATKTIDLANTYFRRSNRGLVLWIVPTTQIYNQTLSALRDRDHPYRQTLDNASGGRTLILERTQQFSPADIEENLCVLMLMLPAAARQTKETLRMFRDSGGFDAFFPSEEDYEGHSARLNKVPNLDTFDTSEFSVRQIKTSLGNTLRTLNPLVILDEGQKAYSALARATIEGFNPCMVVELSATPPQGHPPSTASNARSPRFWMRRRNYSSGTATGRVRIISSRAGNRTAFTRTSFSPPLAGSPGARKSIASSSSKQRVNTSPESRMRGEISPIPATRAMSLPFAQSWPRRSAGANWFPS